MRTIQFPGIAQGCRLHRLWPCFLFLAATILAGCASTPSLRATNEREAKIDVFPTGEIHVFNEPIAPKDLNKIVRNSKTDPKDVVLIRLHGEVDSPAMLSMRKLVSKQMNLSGHSRYQFVSMPHASVTTYDKQTGRSETYTDPNPVKHLSGADIRKEVETMEAEAKAYEEGTYVSDAADRKPTELSNERPEDLTVKPTYGGKPARTTNDSKESLKERWKKQQQRRYRR